MQKYIHFIQSTFTNVDTRLFASKGIPVCQQTTINTILLYIRDDKISITQDIFPACWGVDLSGSREISCLIEILLSLMYSRTVLMVDCWRYGIPFDADGCVSTLINVDGIK